MISCPNCGKDIADDSVHCGHCGHKIEVESKKTMMGFGAAVDADALRAKLDKAKKREGKDSSEGSTLPRPSQEGTSQDQDEEAPDMAPTQLMDSVESPSPGGGDGDEELSDLETAATEIMDQPAASDFDEFEDEADDAFAATKAMSTVETQKVSASDEDEAPAADTDTGGRWQIDDGAESEPAVEAAGTGGEESSIEVGSDLESDTDTGVDAAQDEAGSAQEEEKPSSAQGGGRDLMQMRKGGDVSASDDGQGGDAGDGEAVAGMDDYLDEDGEEGEGPDKKLIIGGVVALLLLGCCGIGCVSSFVFGVF